MRRPDASRLRHDGGSVPHSHAWTLRPELFRDAADAGGSITPA
jgi:hypothetical protein